MSTIYWDITNQCNLRCTHCYQAEALDGCQKEMSLEQCKQVIDKLDKREHIHFRGGEPLLRKDMGDLCSYISQKGLSYSIVTNGLLLDEGHIQTMCRTHAKFLAISLEGTTKLSYERIRGKHTFEPFIKKISRVMEWVGKHGGEFVVFFNITLDDNNYSEVEDFFLFAKQYGIKELVFNKMVCAGRAQENNVGITAENWMDACEQIALLDKKNDIKVSIVTKPLTLSYLNTKYNTGYDTGINNCSVMKRETAFLIRENGDIFPCTGWSELQEMYGDMGNVMNMENTGLMDFKETNPLVEDIKAFYSQREFERPCSQCYMRNQCTGCLLHQYKYNTLVPDVDECVEVNQRIEHYRDVLFDQEIEIREEVLEHAVLKEDVIEIEIGRYRMVLKNDVMDFFQQLRNNTYREWAGIPASMKKQYLYDFKRMKMIKGA